MSKFKTRHTKSWEDISLYPDFAKWITSVPGCQLLAICKYCKGNPINLSNMGIQAPKSHCRGAKHLKLIAAISNVRTKSSFRTDSQDITKLDSTAKVSEVTTCSKKEAGKVFFQWLLFTYR